MSDPEKLVFIPEKKALENLWHKIWLQGHSPEELYDNVRRLELEAALYAERLKRAMEEAK